MEAAHTWVLVLVGRVKANMLQFWILHKVNGNYRRNKIQFLRTRGMEPLYFFSDSI
jgi:hypothetical protein